MALRLKMRKTIMYYVLCGIKYFYKKKKKKKKNYNKK